MALTRLPSFTLLSTDSYTFGNANITGNIVAGNLKTDNLQHANGTAYTFATEAQGSLADSAVQPGDLSTVATSGSYTDLSNKPSLFDGEYASLANKPSLFSGSYVDLTNKPTLGTAAATDASAYATAAQGTKADTALQSADLVGYATESYVGNSIANLVASAPAALDTLNELATALGNDASYSTSITNALANKLSTSNFASTANTWISTQSTSGLSEGTNLYYTDIRANTAIDARVTKSFVDNLAVAANTSNVAYSVAGANVSGQVANSLVAGTVYTNAQPNITSVGTLTSLTVTGNVTANYIIGDGSLLTGLPASYTNSNVADYLPTYAGDLSPGNITIAPANLKISGGTADYVLKTDGAGNLSWTAQTGGTGASDLANLTDVALANLTDGDILSYDSANSVWINTVSTGGTGSASSQYVTRTYTGDGANTAFTVSSGATTNSVIVSLSGIIQTPTSDYSVTGTTLSFTTAPPNGISIQIREIGIPMASGSNTQLLFNDAGAISGTANLTFNKTSGMLTAAKLTTTSANLGDAANLRLTGGNVGDLLATVGNGVLAWANVAANGNVIITSSGSDALANLTDVALANLTNGDILSYDSANSKWINIVNTGGSGSSNIAFTVVTTVDTFVGDGTTTVYELTTAPDDINNLTVNYNGEILLKNTYSISGANITFGSAPATGAEFDVILTQGAPLDSVALYSTSNAAVTSGTVTTNAQPNITSVGTLTSLTVSGNVTAGNILTDNLLYANGSPWSLGGGGGGATVTVSSNPPSSPTEGALWVDSDTGDMSVYFGNAWAAITAQTSTAETVTANNQPNITSVGTLTSLVVSGNVTSGNVKTDNLLYANGDPYSFGGAVAVSGIAPVSPSEGDLWLDNNTGEMSIYFSNAWATVGGGATPSIPAGSSSQVQFNANGLFSTNANFTFDTSTETLSVSKISSNGAALFSITGSNVSGQVANSLVSGTVYSSAQPNITSVGTLANLTVSGSATFSGANLNVSGAATFSGLVTTSSSSEVIQPKSSATGVVVHDISVGTSFYHTTPSANFTANFTNVPTTNDRVLVVALVVVQGSTAYVPNAVQIDGAAQTIKWLAGAAPTGNASKTDIISFSLVRTGSAWVVFGQYSDYS